MYCGVPNTAPVADRTRLSFEIAEQDLREPEVEHLDDLAVRVIREHQVMRLEVTVDDACKMRVVERIGDLREDAERHLDR
ncbi:MAG: hypothetical protein ABJE66_27150 [Deltaproteobacteria bacterium]